MLRALVCSLLGGVVFSCAAMTIDLLVAANEVVVDLVVVAAVVMVTVALAPMVMLVVVAMVLKLAAITDHRVTGKRRHAARTQA